ncbi:hypothetical protein AK812_SmicGene39797 [Symbiodinium microadriaticum]|uniref:Uncharacterized protein n=1 Tax=Symbiodinium microadriaticum TaxID=2951 RepID=A0A1Q9CAA7_SYMMI|nr:hypothetical protein AK812_SmicGene39797 [Symbiodinium microadriaticum]
MDSWLAEIIANVETCTQTFPYGPSPPSENDQLWEAGNIDLCHLSCEAASLLELVRQRDPLPELHDVLDDSWSGPHAARAFTVFRTSPAMDVPPPRPAPDQDGVCRPARGNAKSSGVEESLLRDRLAVCLNGWARPCGHALAGMGGSKVRSRKCGSRIRASSGSTVPPAMRPASRAPVSHRWLAGTIRDYLLGETVAMRT